MRQHNEKSMVDLFVTMERELPVNNYDIDGVKVWPYMRLSIKNKLDSYFLVNGGQPLSPRPDLTFRHKLAVTFRTLKNAIKLSANTLVSLPFKHYFSSKPYDLLMFSFNSSYLGVGDKEINRNLIGIQHGLELAGHNSYQIWEYTSLHEVKKKADFPGGNIAVMCAALNEWCRFRIACSDLVEQKEYGFVEEVNDYLQKHNVPVRLESYKLKHEIKRIGWLANIIERYLLKHQVRKVINICYYGFVGMAVNLACYRQGILSIEYQHGVQTQYHPLYSHWSNVPEAGYALLPEAFWVWGQATHRVIEDWVSQQSFHKVKIVGNTWLEYFREKVLVDSTLSLLQSDRYQGKKLALISLQAFPEHYKKYVTAAIKKSDEDWLWVLKEHPRFPLTETQLQQEFGELLDQGKVVVERSISIYEMLSLLPIKVHLTAFSTVAFECEYFNVPTIFFHENGIDGNAAHIEESIHFFSAYDADSLLKCVNEAECLREIKSVYMANTVIAVDSLMKDVA